MTRSLIDGAVAGHIFSRAEAEAVMEELLSGRVETPDIVRLLAAMNKRPVRVEELAGFARGMRRPCLRTAHRGPSILWTPVGPAARVSRHSTFPRRQPLSRRLRVHEWRSMVTAPLIREAVPRT